MSKTQFLKFWIMSLTLCLLSCSDDDTETNDPETFTLSFNTETNQDQMGDFSHNKMVVFNGEVWSVGGYNSYNTSISNDVWKSDDGASWESIALNPTFTSRIGHSLTVFDNKMWLLGGFTEETPGNFSALSDVLYSTDGETWTIATEAPLGTTDIGYHSTVVFNNKLYIIKDGYNESAAGCTVWSSSDGVTWVRETANAFPHRDDFSATVFNNEIYVTGGTWGSTFFNEIWKSADGINWTQVTTGSTIFSPRAGNAFIVYENKLWLFGGRNGTSTISGMGLWYSDNGEQWSRYEPLPANDGIQDFVALNFNSAIWVFGGMHQDDGSILKTRVGTINTIIQD